MSNRGESPRLPLRLHPRLRLDISFGDLLFALGACVLSLRRDREQRVLRAWAGGDDGLVCLSVRSAFDLLLQAVDLDAGDEIVMSAVTHPDMVRIAEAHGLRVHPVDLDLEALGPRIELLERAITARTRLVVVAHLFGGRVDIEPLARIARRHDLLVVEDCAQGFRGPSEAGDPFADVSLFSFGAIKTATALGGCLAQVRDAELRARMDGLQRRWPLQSRAEYAGRTAKFVALVAVGQPRAYALFARVLALTGRDLDAFVSGAVRGFPGAELVRLIRRRPSAPLLALLERRLRRFDADRLERRARLGEQVASELPADVVQPGRSACDRTHWVFPVATPAGNALRLELRSAGFDAAKATTGIGFVPAPADRPDLRPQDAIRLLERIVFLPVYPEMERDIGRLLETVAQSVRNRASG